MWEQNFFAVKVKISSLTDLSAFCRFLFLILTLMLVNCVVLNFNINLVKTESFFVIAMWRTFNSSKVWKINKIGRQKETSSNIMFISESFSATKDTFGRIDLLVNNAEVRNDKFWELETDVNLVRQIILFQLSLLKFVVC